MYSFPTPVGLRRRNDRQIGNWDTITVLTGGRRTKLNMREFYVKPIIVQRCHRMANGVTSKTGAVPASALTF